MCCCCCCHDHGSLKGGVRAILIFIVCSNRDIHGLRCSKIWKAGGLFLQDTWRALVNGDKFKTFSMFFLALIHYLFKDWKPFLGCGACTVQSYMIRIIDTKPTLPIRVFFLHVFLNFRNKGEIWCFQVDIVIVHTFHIGWCHLKTLEIKYLFAHLYKIEMMD